MSLTEEERITETVLAVIDLKNLVDGFVSLSKTILCCREPETMLSSRRKQDQQNDEFPMPLCRSGVQEEQGR